MATIFSLPGRTPEAKVAGGAEDSIYIWPTPAIQFGPSRRALGQPLILLPMKACPAFLPTIENFIFPPIGQEGTEEWIFGSAALKAAYGRPLATLAPPSTPKAMKPCPSFTSIMKASIFRAMGIPGMEGRIYS